jgi:hypothetical protein
MTARRDGCFGWLIADLNLDILFTDKNDADEVEKIKEIKAAIAVLRAAGKAKVDPDFYIRGAGFADSESEIAVARAILKARRVHEKGKKCAKS